MKNSPLRVLVVDDDQIDRMAFERYTESNNLAYDYTFAGSVKEAKEILEKREFDAVLLDYMLGDGTAFDLFDKVGHAPFVIVTGTGDEEIAVNAMKQGAYDYLIKDNDGSYLKTLTVTVDNAIKRKQAEDELRKYREHLEDLVKQRTVKLNKEIGERKKVEKELLDARDKLEKRVAERTIELQNMNRELHKEINNREKIEKQIKRSLKEKEVLLKEIHHRVKNNLQIISSLLSLQSRQINDKKTFDLFQESQGRVRTMALIHEKLYQSPDLAKIDSAGYINSLARGLYRAYHVDLDKIGLTVKAEKIELSVDLAVPCGLIINELVSNALKYAFPEPNKKKDHIHISLSRAGSHGIKLCVKDNGIGMPSDIKIRNTESLGLQLVTLLAEEQLQGEVKIFRVNGTKFLITFELD